MSEQSNLYLYRFGTSELLKEFEDESINFCGLIENAAKYMDEISGDEFRSMWRDGEFRVRNNAGDAFFQSINFCERGCYFSGSTQQKDAFSNVISQTTFQVYVYGGNVHLIPDDMGLVKGDDYRDIDCYSSKHRDLRLKLGSERGMSVGNYKTIHETLENSIKRPIMTECVDTKKPAFTKKRI